MTDGTNTVAPYADGNYGSPYDAGYGAGSSYADGLTASLCTKIKAEGTVVYTVLFDVTDANIETLLRTCASDSGQKLSWPTMLAELLTAFKDIGASLTKLQADAVAGNADRFAAVPRPSPWRRPGPR